MSVRVSLLFAGESSSLRLEGGQEVGEGGWRGGVLSVRGWRGEGGQGVGEGGWRILGVPVSLLFAGESSSLLGLSEPGNHG